MRVFFTSAGVVLLSTSFVVHAQPTGQTMTPEDMQWRPGRVPGSQIADLLGDGTKPGPYVQRLRFPANFSVQPHTHPDDRQYTVISGTWYVGWGTTFDPARMKALPAGSFYTEPANVPHFVMTRDEPVVVQLVGTAPTATQPVPGTAK